MWGSESILVHGREAEINSHLGLTGITLCVTLLILSLTNSSYTLPGTSEEYIAVSADAGNQVPVCFQIGSVDGTSFKLEPRVYLDRPKQIAIAAAPDGDNAILAAVRRDGMLHSLLALN